MLVIAFDTLKNLLQIMEDSPAIYENDGAVVALDLLGDLAELHVIEVDEGVIFR